MPVQTPLAAAIFFTLWWVLFLAMLPLGVRSLHEDGNVPKGFDPGAPVAPRLWTKAGLTTIVTAVVWGLLMLVLKFMG
jgi:predicted secreted protein